MSLISSNQPPSESGPKLGSDPNFPLWSDEDWKFLRKLSKIELNLEQIAARMEKPAEECESAYFNGRPIIDGSKFWLPCEDNCLRILVERGPRRSNGDIDWTTLETSGEIRKNFGDTPKNKVRDHFSKDLKGRLTVRLLERLSASSASVKGTTQKTAHTVGEASSSSSGHPTSSTHAIQRGGYEQPTSNTESSGQQSGYSQIPNQTPESTQQGDYPQTAYQSPYGTQPTNYQQTAYPPQDDTQGSGHAQPSHAPSGSNAQPDRGRHRPWELR